MRVLVLAASCLIICWIYSALAGLGLDYEWQWNRVWRHFGSWTANGFKPGPLMEGILMTCGIAFWGMLLSVFLGLFFSLLRLSPWPGCQCLAKIYVCLWRNTPLLLQLFFVYFLIAPVFNLGPFYSAILALGAFEGAYMAEIFRAGLLGVSRTQWEAGLSLGFNLFQCLTWIILPQAARQAQPALVNQAVSLIKDTSLASAIAVADLTMRAQAIVAETFLAFEVWLLVGGIYLILATLVSLPGLWLEKRQSWQ